MVETTAEPAKKVQKPKVVVYAEYDGDVACPQDVYDGTWRLYSFNSHHTTFRHPDTFRGIGFRRKLQRGTAHFLSYYEHGGSLWSLAGEGPQCGFDTVQCAGVLVWEESPKILGAKTVEDRQKDAQGYLDEFNAWANGECFCYRIENENGDILGFCGGFIGRDYFRDELRRVLAGYEPIEWRGDAAYAFKEEV